MNVLKTSAQFIAWLATSVAGIAAIFYAAGYLITRAHLHLLGLDALMDYRHEEYVQEGAKFFYVVFQIVGDLFIGLYVTVACLLAAIALLVAIVCLGRSRMLGVDIATYAKGWRSRRNGFMGRWQLHVHVGLFAVCMLLFFPFCVEQLQTFREPLQLTHLLYERNDGTAAAATQSPDPPLDAWIRNRDIPRLQDHFSATLLPRTFLAVGLLWLARHLTVGWRGRTILLAPFVIVTLMYVMLLPMLYGVLVRTSRLPRIVLHSQSTEDETLYLLDKSDEAFVVWDPVHATVLWMPTREVVAAELREDDVILR